MKITISNRTNSIAMFLFLFAIFYIAFAIVKIFTEIYAPYLLTLMFNFRSPTILWDKAKLDYVGFCGPLIASIAMVYLSARSRSKKTHWMSWVILAAILIADLFYSLYVHELRPIYSTGGGINYVASAAVVGFIIYLIFMDVRKEGAYISFILGFVIGAISDLESITHTPVATTYGGGGIFDADFLLPFSMMLAYLLMLKLGVKAHSITLRTDETIMR